MSKERIVERLVDIRELAIKKGNKAIVEDLTIAIDCIERCIDMDNRELTIMCQRRK